MEPPRGSFLQRRPRSDSFHGPCADLHFQARGCTRESCPTPCPCLQRAVRLMDVYEFSLLQSSSPHLLCIVQTMYTLTHARTHKHSLMYTLMHTYTHALVHTNLQICARDVLWHELFSYTGCIGTLNWIFCCTLPFFILSLVFSLNTLCNRLILFLMLVFKICTDVSYADGII